MMASPKASLWSPVSIAVLMLAMVTCPLDGARADNGPVINGDRSN